MNVRKKKRAIDIELYPMRYASHTLFHRHSLKVNVSIIGLWKRKIGFVTKKISDYFTAPMNLQSRSIPLYAFKLKMDWTSEEREYVKEKAAQSLRHLSSANQRASIIVESYIAAHFWRAKEALDNAPRELRENVLGKDTNAFLEKGRYYCNWLWANGDNLDEEVLSVILKCYGYKPLESRFMKKGRTTYHL